MEYTLVAKESHKLFCESNIVTIKIYCAENVQFSEQYFRDTCNITNKYLNLCVAGNN